MTARTAARERHAGMDLAHWGLCLLLVLGAHGAALLWLRHTTPEAIGMASPPPAILLELAPQPVAPPQPAPPEPVTPPQPTPPEPPQPAPVVPEPAPQPPTPTPPEVAPEPPLPAVPPLEVPPPEVTLPPPPPVPRSRPASPRRPAEQHRPPPVSPETAQPAPAAPAPAPAPVQAAPPTGAVPANWETAIVAHLARFKRYPVAAERRGEEGVALVRFVVDRGGSVLSAALVRSSGHADLDREALAWIERAQPLPAPPPEITRTPVDLVIPLRFELH